MQKKSNPIGKFIVEKKPIPIEKKLNLEFCKVLYVERS